MNQPIAIQRNIRDYQTYLAAKKEIASLNDGSGELSMDAFARIQDLRDEMKIFENFLPIDQGHPSAASMLAYASEYLKPLTDEAAAAELGITDLCEIRRGRRLPTEKEAERLSRYFEIAPDSFLA